MPAAQHDVPPRESGRLSRFSISLSSLQLHMVFIVIFAIAPISIVLLFTSFEMRKIAETYARSGVGHISDFIATNERQLIGGTRQLLESLAFNPDVQRADTAICARLFADILGAYERYTNIGLADLSGNVIASGLPMRSAVSIADRSYFKLARETGGLSVGEFQIGRITGRRGINLGYPVRDRSGRLTGIVYAAMSIDWLNQYERTVVEDLPPGSILTTIDRGGTILVNVPDTMFVGKRLADDHPFSRELSLKDGFFTAMGTDRSSRIYAYATVSSPLFGDDIFIIAGIPKTAMYADVNSLLLRIIVMCVLIGAALVGIAWALGAVLYRRPLRDLVRSTNELASGNLDARAHAMPGVSELARLAVAFNDMAVSLQRSNAERRRAAAESEELQQQLAQAQKMEALGTLTGAIAHDFNNLLVAIKGNAELALARTGRDAPVHEDLREIVAAADRAARLTHQLLTFSRRQPLRFAAVDLNSLTQGMATMLDRMIGDNISLTFDLAPDVPPVDGDETSIEQIIVNLVVNAKDAMPDGGSITIRTDGIEADLGYCRVHADARPGWYVRLSVSDTGVGMDQETLSRVFEPFFTTKPAGEGVGWGLTVVYAAAKQHSGWVEVTSAPGAGSRFDVFFPVSAEGEVRAPEQRPAAGDLRGTGERILIVEDNDAVRDFFVRALAGNGYVVRSAATLEEALSILRAEPGAYDLAIADVVLPDGNGLQLAEVLGAEYPRTHIILCTGFVGEKARLDAIRDQGIPFLQKPFSIVALLRVVRETIRPRRATRSPREP